MPTIPEMERLGWGNPDAKTYASRNLVSIAEGGRTFRVRREAAPLFQALVILLGKAGVDIDRGVLDDWSYANRDIRGYPGYKSYHAWGLAIDVDATKNALGSHTTSFPIAATQRAARDCSLTWGYNWASRPDPMHFEFNRPRAEIKDAYNRLMARHPLIWKAVRP